MHDEDGGRPSRGLVWGLIISAILYLLAGLVWLAL
jgi:hypothetical protein